MTDFQIFEDKYQVPMRLIILKWEEIGKTEKEGNGYMSVMDEASHIETDPQHHPPSSPFYSNYKNQISSSELAIT